MPYPGTTIYRSELDHPVLKELDEHNAWLNSFLSAQHGPNGEHGNVTAISIDAGSITINGKPIDATLPPNIAFTNVSNPWSVFQVFPFAGLRLRNNANTFNLALAALADIGADQTLNINQTPANTQINLTQTPITLGDWFDQGVKTTSSPTFNGVTAVNGFFGTLHGSVLAPNAGIWIESLTTGNYLRLGSLTNMTASRVLYFDSGDVPDRVITLQGNTVLADWFNQSVKTTASPTFNVVAANVNAPNYLIAQDYVWAAQRLYVQGFRVTVTADCTIPGSGGGAILPPTLAYTDATQSWSAAQGFNAGVTINGGLTVAGVDWNTYFNQAVRTDSSPTFAGMSLNGNLSLTGNIHSNFSISTDTAFSAAGSLGITITRVISGTTLVFKGGILVG